MNTQGANRVEFSSAAGRRSGVAEPRSGAAAPPAQPLHGAFWRLLLACLTSLLTALSAPPALLAQDETHAVTQSTGSASPVRDSTVTTDEDKPYTFAAKDFEFKDDVLNDELKIMTVVTLPARGTLTFGGKPVLEADLELQVAADDIGALVFTPGDDENNGDTPGPNYTQFKFRLSDGTDESDAAHDMNVSVEQVNDSATGAPTVRGRPEVGETLTAVTTGIDDVDGVTEANAGAAPYAYQYQWMRGDDADGTSDDITDATSADYVVTAADVGNRLQVKVSFYDDDKNHESRTSELTSEIYHPAPGTIKDDGGICERTEAVQTAILAALKNVSALRRRVR